MTQPELSWRRAEQQSEGLPISLTASDGSGLELVSIEARAVIEDPLAFTELHLRFRNPEARRREGRFQIRLPPTAAVSRFAMRIGGSFQEGELVERRRAQQVYEDFLHQKQDPALLEKAAGNEFGARVFPIEPDSVSELIVSYSEELERRDAPYRLLVSGLPRLADLAVEVQLGGPAAGSGKPRLSLRQHDVTPSADLEVRLPQRKPIALQSGELAVARVAPVVEVPKVTLDRLTVLFDTSASRALGFAAQIERLAALAAELEKHGGRAISLRVVAFDQGVEEVYSGPASAFDLRAQGKLLARDALGASDLGQALEYLASRPDSSARLLVMGDGVITAGSDDTTRLREAVARLAAHGVRRLDVLAEGGIQDRDTLTALTRAGLGETGVVLDASQPVATLAERMLKGTRERIEVHIAGARWVYPTVLEGVQPGDEHLVFAELPEGVPVQIELLGAGAEAYDTREMARPLLERAWARAKIEALTRERRALGDDARAGRLERDIVELSLSRRVVSDYTAWLVLEGPAQYARFGLDRRALSNILRVGERGLELWDRQGPPVLQIAADEGALAMRRESQGEPLGTSNEPRPAAAAPAEEKAVARPTSVTPSIDAEPLGHRRRDEESEPVSVARGRAPSDRDDFASDKAKRAAPVPPPAAAPAPAAASADFAGPIAGRTRSTGAMKEESSPALQASSGGAALRSKKPQAAIDDFESPLGRPAQPSKSSAAALDYAPLAAANTAPGAASAAARGASSAAARGDAPLAAAERDTPSQAALGDAPLAAAERRVAPGAGMGSGAIADHALAGPTLQLRSDVRLRSANALPPSETLRALRSLAARSKDCTASSAREGQRLSFELEIDDKGAVSSASAGAWPDRQASSCFLARARATRFPKPNARRGFVSAELAWSQQIVLPTARPVAAKPRAPRIPSPALEAAYDGVLSAVLDATAHGDRSQALSLANAAHADAPADVIGLIALGEALEANADFQRAARAYGSIIDLFPARADLRRMAGARLERLPLHGIALAVDSYRRAAAQRPDHPSGQRLLAYALLKQSDGAEAFETLQRALDRSYDSNRFEGVDRILREDLALIGAAWVRVDPAAEAHVSSALAARGVAPARTPSTRFVLNWETDANDVDFHIYDGRGGHAYYMQRRLGSGGQLYADITTGYGPECFAIPSRAAAYPYVLQAHYFARGPMGYGMGKLQVIDHDGKGGLSFAEHPFVIMKDKAFVELARVNGPLAKPQPLALR